MRASAEVNAVGAAWHVESERSAWPRPRRSPHPVLRQCLARDYVGSTEAIGRHRLLLPATTSVGLVFKIRDSPHRPPAFLTGPLDSFCLLEGECAPSYLEVWLAPLGAYQLLGLPLNELQGRTVDLGDVLGPAGARLANRIRDASTWGRRFTILDEALLERAADGPRPSPEVARAWRLLVAAGGRVEIGRIAADVGWSHKHLITRFRSQTGLSPKTAARLVRFQRVVGHLTAGEATRWEQIAADHGYADQAHLARDFRMFAGTTPTGFLCRIRQSVSPPAAGSG